jgi:very-short-patch-repair endonuclease
MLGIRHAKSDRALWLTDDHRVLVRRRRYVMNGQRTWGNIPGETFGKARELRKNQTAAERLLWAEVRGEKLGIKFRRQHPIGAYIADFFCPECALVIEIDGDSHFTPEQQEYDAVRTAAFRAHGIDVVRYTNHDIVHNLRGILENLVRRIGETANGDFQEEAVWLRAEYLREGDVVYYGQNTEPVEITSIEREETDEEVFDIEVEGTHSFITEVCAVKKERICRVRRHCTIQIRI